MGENDNSKKCGGGVADDINHDFAAHSGEFCIIHLGQCWRNLLLLGKRKRFKTLLKKRLLLTADIAGQAIHLKSTGTHIVFVHMSLLVIIGEVSLLH